MRRVAYKLSATGGGEFRGFDTFHLKCKVSEIDTGTGGGGIVV